MSDTFSLSDILDAIAKLKSVGGQPDTLIMHPKIHRRMFEPLTLSGNAHQRRIARRTNARRLRFKDSLMLPVEFQ